MEGREDAGQEGRDVMRTEKSIVLGDGTKIVLFNWNSLHQCEDPECPFNGSLVVQGFDRTNFNGSKTSDFVSCLRVPDKKRPYGIPITNPSKGSFFWHSMIKFHLKEFN
jgi:hypothetical protein